MPRRRKKARADEPKQAGRPALPDEERKDWVMQFRVTTAVREELLAAAEREGLKFSEWALVVLLCEARGGD